MPRDLVGYGGNYPKVSWPNDARIAVSVVVHFEEGAEYTPINGDRLIENSIEGIFIDQAAPNEEPRRDVRIESMFEYGPRCGFWRLVDIFEESSVKVTFFCSGQAAERSPAAAREITALGHEACGHGYRWLPYHAFSEAEERADIRKADRGHREDHRATTAWLEQPGSNAENAWLLLDAGGFVYDSDSYGDDLPYFAVAEPGRSLLTIPYNVDVTDDKYWAPPPTSGFTNPDAFFDVMKRTFDRLWAEGEHHPKMMSVGLHLRISGRPSRAKQIERFIRYAQGFPRVWFARRLDIARWWLEHGPRP